MLAPSDALLMQWCRRYIAERDLTPRTAETYRGAVARFERWHAASATLPDLAERINEYICVLVSGNRYTAKSARQALVALLRAGAEVGLCDLPARIRPVKLSELCPQAFSPREIHALLIHATEVQRAAIHLAYDSGMRRGDLFAAVWQETFEAGGETRLVRAQNKSRRRIVRRLRPETVAALAAIKKEESRLLGKMTPTIWRRAWRQLGKRAGVNVYKRGLQAIRRTGATLSKKAGYSASEYLGHSPRSAGLAEAFYLDPRLLDEAPPLPPPITG